MDRLSELLGRHVQFSYTPLDRIVLNGCIDRLQRPENLVYFFHSCHQRFLHHCFYVLDPVLGPMCLRVATSQPFNVTCYLNGHSFLAQELTRQGITFRYDRDQCTLPRVAGGTAGQHRRVRRACQTGPSHPDRAPSHPGHQAAR